MIRDVVKYLIIGTTTHLDRFFERAQEMGFLEFISVSSKKPATLPESVQTLIQALKILKEFPEVPPHTGAFDTDFGIQIAHQIVEHKHEIQKLAEEKRILRLEEGRVRPFGDFSISDIKAIEKMGKRKVQFFCRKVSPLNAPSEAIYIRTEYDLEYFIAISEKPVHPEGMIEMKIEMPLGEIRDRLDFIDAALKEHEKQLRESAGYVEHLKSALVDTLNTHHLKAAKQETSYPLDNSLFAIEAYLPANKAASLFALIDGMSIHAEQIAITPDDKVPTCLDNTGVREVGEDLIKIYDVPAITDKDPSTWVLIFFTLFFAVIVGDGGYGLVFLLFAIYLKFKFPQLKGQAKRMLKLLTIVSIACIGWGVMTSSYFGLKLSSDNFLTKISPIQALVVRKADYHLKQQDDVYHSWLSKFPQIAQAKTGDEMLQMGAVQKKQFVSYPMSDEFYGNIILELTLIIGIVHISFSFLRYLRRNIAGLGWIVFMIGCYLFFPQLLNATTIVEFMGWISKPISAPFGLQCIYGGVAFALVIAPIQHGLKGFAEIANLVQVSADVLSYLRLYALSLAGAIMATTFNQEGGALGLFFGFIAIIVGHFINILLSLMGGVIHGLRLNFLEWYHYCFDGGGRLFKPLQKLKTKG